MGTEERKIFIAFGWVATYIAALMIYFIVNLLRQQKKYKKLQKEKLISEIQASELQRNHIATELHNDIGPYLSSVKMRLELVQTAQTKELEICKNALDKCIVQIRTMSKTIAPFSDQHNSFIDALKTYVHAVNVSNSLSIELIELDKVQLSVDQNSQLYRLLQEIIQNTIKHAQASVLKIELSRSDNDMLIRTSDNGVGYDFDAVRSQHKLGLGLLGIYSRVDYLNGTISKDDSKRAGTRYNIRIPLTLN